MISISTDFNIAKALREIRKYQNSTELLIPYAPFVRVVREIMHDISPGRVERIRKDAVQALQEATEAMLVNEFE